MLDIAIRRANDLAIFANFLYSKYLIDSFAMGHQAPNDA